MKKKNFHKKKWTRQHQEHLRACRVCCFPLLDSSNATLLVYCWLHRWWEHLWSCWPELYGQMWEPKTAFFNPLSHEEYRWTRHNITPFTVFVDLLVSTRQAASTSILISPGRHVLGSFLGPLLANTDEIEAVDIHPYLAHCWTSSIPSMEPRHCASLIIVRIIFIV